MTKYDMKKRSGSFRIYSLEESGQPFSNINYSLLFVKKKIGLAGESIKKLPGKAFLTNGNTASSCPAVGLGSEDLISGAHNPALELGLVAHENFQSKIIVTWVLEIAITRQDSCGSYRLLYKLS
jgi:hypothetical protein